MLDIMANKTNVLLALIELLEWQGEKMANY